jgi:hypothetical protein
VLYREHFHLLPLVLIGLPALLRRTRTYAVTVLAIAFGALLGVVLLSVPAVKEPLYVLAVLPPLYMLAGTCLAELERDSARYRPANTATAQAGIAIAALSAIAVWITRAGSALQLEYAWLHSAGMLASAAVAAFWIARRQVMPAVIVICALALAGGALRGVAAQRSEYASLARAIAPCLDSAEPAYPSFVAPHSKLLMGYLGRAGRDWPAAAHALELLSAPSLQVFVFGAEQRGDRALDSVVERLERSEAELRVGRGYRVFVRADLNCARAR